MNKNLKITLIVVGVLGTGVGLYYLLRPSRVRITPSNNGTNNSPNIKTVDKFSGRGFPLKKGSGGVKVENLQRFLNDAGSYGLKVDGKFGSNTEAALKSEQAPFEVFKSMYPNAVEGQASEEYYNNAML
jgi:peptidoglycan hydrolase-like protein with peptidoglycan-binding domain